MPSSMVGELKQVVGMHGEKCIVLQMIESAGVVNSVLPVFGVRLVVQRTMPDKFAEWLITVLPLKIGNWVERDENL